MNGDCFVKFPFLNLACGLHGVCNSRFRLSIYFSFCKIEIYARLIREYENTKMYYSSVYFLTDLSQVTLSVNIHLTTTFVSYRNVYIKVNLSVSCFLFTT